MATQIEALQDERLELHKELTAIQEHTKAEKRDMNPEEIAKFDELADKAEGLGKKIEKLEEAETRSNRLAALDTAIEGSKGRKSTPENPETRDHKDGERESPEGKEKAMERRAFNQYLRGGHAMLGPEEVRSLSKSKGTEGGFLSAPQQFQAELIKAVDDMTWIRELSRTFTVNTAESLGAPSLEADPADPTWVAEISTGSEDSTMALGKRELTPHPAAQLLKVSGTLLRRSALDPDALVRDRLAFKLGILQEKEFLTGDGSNSPLGVFTASDDGISTSYDVSTGNTTTAIKADNLIEVVYTLKEGYRRNSTWVFHRDALKMIRKLKDGDGQYLWIPGLAGNQESTILDRPFRSSEYAPNTFTTGLYVGILGDFSYYWIADALTMQIQRLDELYAAANQVGFITRIEADGMPVLGEAFARVTLA